MSGNYSKCITWINSFNSQTPKEIDTDTIPFYRSVNWETEKLNH